LISLAGLSCSGRRDGREIRASGTIEAVEVKISSKVNGQVESLSVEEGDRVKEGDVLAQIDHEALDLQLAQAEAAAGMAESQLRLLRQGARSEDIRQAEEAVRQAEAMLKVADADAARFRNLYDNGGISKKQKEDAEARATVARAQYNSAAEVLNKVRKFVRPEELQTAEAKLAQAQAAAGLLRKMISDSAIVSPVEGIVTGRLVEKGELVSSGTPVLTISELDRVHVMIYVTADELGRIKLGDPAGVKIDSYPDRTFFGIVTYISPEAEFTPKNIQTREERVKLVFRVKVEMENPEGILKPGMPADAVVRLGPEGST
jgi:HlyD family secretion protein